jgi:Asp-tRNA(Asn)/Glu-tRNA(Gln) amidotransferase A subunit family amidase
MGNVQVVETTIAQVQAAMRSGELTARELVQAYLDRIAAYDKSGPELNSIITLNEKALEEADLLDAEFKRTGELVGSLHGIPVLVKDQAETAGIMTTFGSKAIDGYVPEKDATVIGNLRRSGAIILGKTNMPDFATSWFAYSSKGGISKNPYDLTRDPGGSSSGTGAAIAANLGLVGIGEDTGGSIRLPASFDSLVGVRVTPGLISRNGMSPLVVFQDTAGPMARTVTDAAVLLDAMVGYDPTDEYTSAYVVARAPESYADAIQGASLEGLRVGVVREAFGSDSDPDCAQVNAVIEKALDKMREAGAELVDVEIPTLMDFIVSTSLYITHSRHDINGFLANHDFRFKTVEDILAAKEYHPYLELLEAIGEGPANPTDDPEYFPKMAEREKFQRAIVNAMAKVRATVLVYPTIQVVPPTREELDGGKWTTLTFPTNTLIASQSWMPAVSVPAGATPEGLPVGMEIVGLPFDEVGVLSAALAFEQAVQGRIVPSSTPEL